MPTCPLASSLLPPLLAPQTLLALLVLVLYMGMGISGELSGARAGRSPGHTEPRGAFWRRLPATVVSHLPSPTTLHPTEATDHAYVNCRSFASLRGVSVPVSERSWEAAERGRECHYPQPPAASQVTYSGRY